MSNRRVLGPLNPLGRRTFLQASAVVVASRTLGCGPSEDDVLDGATRSDATRPLDAPLHDGSLAWSDGSPAVEDDAATNEPNRLVIEPPLAEVRVGENASFVARLEGSTADTFRWSDNLGAPVASTAATLTLAAVRASQAGVWRVSVEAGGRTLQATCTLAVGAAPSSDAFVPRGAYVPGGLQWLRAPDRWARIETALDGMRNMGFNAVWWKDDDAADQARIARLAAARGIYLVASLQSFDSAWRLDRPAANDPMVIRNALAAWGDAPRPIAWGLGDEPTAENARYRSFVETWARDFPDEPTTAVYQWFALDGVQRSLPHSRAVTCDVYPLQVQPGARYPADSCGSFESRGVFRRPGSDTDEELVGCLGYTKSIPLVSMHLVNVPTVGVVTREGRRFAKPWMMVAGHQRRWGSAPGGGGPTRYDADGGYCYEPDSAPSHDVVRAAFSRWEAWSAVAHGAKGVFYFAYRLPPAATTGAPGAGACRDFDACPEAPGSTSSNRYPIEFCTGAPMGLVHHQSGPGEEPRLGPAGQGARDAFIKMRIISALLGELERVEAPEAWRVAPPPADPPPPRRISFSGEVAMFRDPRTEARYLLVVADFDGDETMEKAVSFEVGPHISGLRSLFDGSTPELAPREDGFWRATASLVPGDAQFYACTLDRSNLPVGYFEDFETDRYQTESLAHAGVARASYYAGYGQCLHATSGTSAGNHFVDYDLDAILAPLPEGGVRMLRYEGLSTDTPRGAFWWKADRRFTAAPAISDAFSSNRFEGKVAPFSERYLRLGVSHEGFGGREPVHLAGGSLKYFGLAQWARRRS